MSISKKYHIFLNISFLFIILSCFLLNTTTTTHLGRSSISHFLSSSHPFNCTNECCGGPHGLKGHKPNYSHLRSEDLYGPQGYIDYLYIFYCICGKWPVLGYLLLSLWLLVLFYLLGNTASVYFCSSLESLSSILNLSPTMAGVTLLSLGNGAPDVLSSIVSFMGPGSTGDVGLNSVLGGAFFVSSVIVGIISILVAPRGISIEKRSFVRDVCFFIIALSSLLVTLIIGRVVIWGAVAFTSIYIVYVVVVYAMDLRRMEDVETAPVNVDSLFPTDGNFFHCGSPELGYLSTPLLADTDKEPNLTPREASESDGDRRVITRCFVFNSYYFGCFLRFMELPLYLPRRLTIPVVCEERWSKPFAVISVTLAPVLLAALWNSQTADMGLKAGLLIYLTGGLVGMLLGVLAFFTTDRCGPPKRFLLVWLAGGFLMSVIWTYIIAVELVALMASIGDVLGISPSILGLTVLAWGNSVGDLIANVAMSLKDGPDGAQIAISGCYAGPIFNTLVGLGLSLIFSSWRAYPSSIPLSKDTSLFMTVGFLVGGLLWAVVVLPKRGMKLDRVLGSGLLAIYFCFLSLRLGQNIWAPLTNF
ncbi:cation/calcium exchanger 1-like [Magnolia sinica]|uniref:cation/calcium exchanger 1-like n=1 Tax=Magnolia sinica TaxID=86752 RepID=UPI0026594E4B|nr:cation/calcium exchanger 1-like [Magnolia sinica]